MTDAISLNKTSECQNKPVAKTLTVYKASAGSGKTFTLAVNYICLLIKDPHNYSKILAVTFTNKATEEMKTRILSQLYGISRELPDSKDYLAYVSGVLQMSPKLVSDRAGVALTLLLHHYHFFHVTTIDSFFQHVLSNLARELGLSPNLRIELDAPQTADMAVDQLIEKLSPKSHELNWIWEYIKENIKNNENWNVTSQIKQFSKNLFKDFYKTNLSQIDKFFADPRLYQEYRASIKEILDEAVTNMRKPALEFMEITSQKGLTADDFSYGNSGIFNYFAKILNGIYATDKLLSARVKYCIVNDEKWISKKKRIQNPQLHTLVKEQLHPLLLRSEHVRTNNIIKYNSAKLTLQNLYQLRLLSSIEKEIRLLNAEMGQFLLADTQNLLYRLIQDQDTPFIFEKIGSHLEHIMIDEFQDTGTIQWKNFKILLNECMSHDGSHNLIVGDVKQSIYRFRSGDWRLLNDIETHFTEPENRLEIKVMKTNYRSSWRVVEFNNQFFAAAVKWLSLQLRQELLSEKSSDLATAGSAIDNPAISESADNTESQALSDAIVTSAIMQLSKAYEDVSQETPSHKPDEGRVEIVLLDKESYREETLQQMALHIRRLLQSGCRQSDIAILVRKNGHVRLIADYLTQNHTDLQVISGEAFRLDSSPAVNMLIYALQTLAYPNDWVVQAALIKSYREQVLNQRDGDLCLAGDDESKQELLPPAFIDEKDRLAKMPMADLIEELYAIFSLEKLTDQSAYVCCFYDHFRKYVFDNYCGIETFLNYWKQHLCKKTIDSGDVEGIKLLTIHKSKGLEYPHVLLPFCDWTIEDSNNASEIIWCKPSGEDFDGIPLVPVTYQKSLMADSIYRADYIQEHFQNIVDNINLLYVAFTRPSQSLWISTSEVGVMSMGQVITQSIIGIPMEEESSQDVSSLSASSTCRHLVFGSELKVSLPETQNIKSSQNVFLPQISTLPVTINGYYDPTIFRQSNQSKQFIEGETIAPKQDEYIMIGSLMHNVLSMIRTHQDLPQAIEMLKSQGLAFPNVKIEQLIKLLKARLSSPVVQDWFSDRWQIHNECNILIRDPETGITRNYRPDRVLIRENQVRVIDFKFGTPHEAHEAQVANYMSLIRKMDSKYTDVKGYLWYLYDHTIKEIK